MFKPNIVYIILCITGIILPQEFSSINPNHGFKGESLYVEIELSDIDFYNVYNPYNGYTYNYNDYNYWNNYISIEFYNEYNDYFSGGESAFYRDFESEYNEIISSNSILSYINIPNYIESGLYSLYITLFKNDLFNDPIGTITGYSSNEIIGINASNIFEVVLRGDATGDEVVNIQDIIYLIEIVLNIGDNIYAPSESELHINDMNNDANLNIVDIIGLVAIILDQP
tara:strand:+ start:154 stop:834 length:681 start_codon:yes stop_codon:yes gene_type:complete